MMDAVHYMEGPVAGLMTYLDRTVVGSREALGLLETATLLVLRTAVAEGLMSQEDAYIYAYHSSTGLAEALRDAFGRSSGEGLCADLYGEQGEI